MKKQILSRETHAIVYLKTGEVKKYLIGYQFCVRYDEPVILKKDYKDWNTSLVEVKKRFSFSKLKKVDYYQWDDWETLATIRYDIEKVEKLVIVEEFYKEENASFSEIMKNLEAENFKEYLTDNGFLIET